MELYLVKSASLASPNDAVDESRGYAPFT